MENKKIQYSYKGLNQDISKSKSKEYYFTANNIRIIATNLQSTGSVTNEKGNSLLLSIPVVSINKTLKLITYGLKSLSFNNQELNSFFNGLSTFETSGEQKIIGHVFTRNSIILFSTDEDGFDCIWNLDETTNDLSLLYLRNLGFTENNPIQAVNNYENEIIDKIYWVDSKSQMRFLNIHNSILNGDLENLIDLPSNNLLVTGTYNTSQPLINNISFGGNHTSGMIQYAYSLYKINGSSTKLSPLSELIPLDKGESEGGGDINEVVGKIPVVTINNIDQTYSNMRLYALKYTSYNEIPSISLILDKDILGLNSVDYYDDGNIIQSISLEEFTFLGSDIIIPKHINTKKNIMFLANYKEKNFDINTDVSLNGIDLRAYGFKPLSNTSKIFSKLSEIPLLSNNIVGDSIGQITLDNSYINSITNRVPENHPALNENYDLYNRQYNSNIIGGEGPFLKYKIVRNKVGINGFVKKDADKTFLKDNEVYRIAVQFYNEYGQNSLPKWVADFKNTPQLGFHNLNNWLASLEITFKPSFYTWLNNDNNFLDENGNYDPFLKPVGYKLLRADRQLSDRTVVCQGLINGMVSQLNNDTTSDNDVTGNDISPGAIIRGNQGNKLPSMMRRFDEYLAPMWGNKSYLRLDRHCPECHPNYSHPSTGAFDINTDAGNEVFKAKPSSHWSQGTYQFNQLMQMFTPEVTFNSIQNLSQVDFKLHGGMKNNNNESWVQNREPTDKTIQTEIKIKNAISPWDAKAFLPNNSEQIKGNRVDIQKIGFFGSTENDDMAFVQTVREYTEEFLHSNQIVQPVYGVPIITEKGQGRTMYNNDEELTYYNSLIPLASDDTLTNVNSWGAKNITFALDSTTPVDTKDRIKIEQLHSISGITDKGVGLIGEFIVKRSKIYLGNIYGGNSYESKKRTNYIEVGDYKTINTNTYNCLNFGDTFVNNFKFTKLVKTDTEVYNVNSEQLTEIVNVKLETTIDLKNRNDLSLTNWDNRFQPRYDEYQKYNKVYSQQPSFFLRKDLDYRFKSVKSFDTNVISTKVKVPGEIIDSWTDLQPNNTLTLNGQYGPINTLHKFKDELYTLQDNAVAFLSIQPRVQVQGSDGIAVELGTGQVLQQYQYISTESGTLNKWSVVTTPNGFYYYDTLNKSFNVFKGQIQGLSDVKGLHTYLQNNTVLNELKIDNPLIKRGISANYDFINNDLFMTFHQNNKSFTFSFNEGSDSFVSFYDYKPSMYLSKGKTLLTTHPDNNKLYSQYKGDYNNFYDETFPSFITLMVNPEANLDTVFDNIEYRSEIYLNDIDQPNKSLTHVQLYNEYQDSGLIPLIVGRNNNLRRKFRDWNAQLPRNANTRQRIRNPWVFLKLQLTNDINCKMILHDIVVSYSV